MSGGIIGTQAPSQWVFTQWLQTSAGRYLRAWESAQFADAVADVFGYHALQLGLPAMPTLEANRMPHRWLAEDHWPPQAWAHEQSDDARHPLVGAPCRDLDMRCALVTDFAALPFSEASIDLLTLPHTLELCHDPHATLAEAHRVLVPEGKLVLSCLNPISLWGFKQARVRLYRKLGGRARFLPEAGEWMSHRRIRDWLRLLNFEVESVRFGCHWPSRRREPCADGSGGLDATFRRIWPSVGSAYLLVATKRVRGMRLIGPAWRPTPVAGNTAVPVARHIVPRVAREPVCTEELG